MTASEKNIVYKYSFVIASSNSLNSQASLAVYCPTTETLPLNHIVLDHESLSHGEDNSIIPSLVLFHVLFLNEINMTGPFLEHITWPCW